MAKAKKEKAKKIVEEVLPEEILAEELPVAIVEEKPETIGPNSMVIYKREKVVINGREYHKLTLANGSTTLMNDDELDAQLNHEE
jgi:DNA-directed RNA polymerase subunit F